MIAKLSRMFNRLLISCLRRFTCITHRSLYYSEMFIKSNEMLTNSNDWIQTFALGHFAASVKI